MSKAVMISIRPKWCNLIESGKKTIEVRKTRPKIKAPFKCYIYCTQDKHDRFICRGGDDMPFDVGNGMVIGEFVCDGIKCITPGRFIVKEDAESALVGSCLTPKQAKDQAEALAELSTKTQIVGDTTAEIANQFLLAVDAAYQYKGNIESLTKVLDSVNEIDNHYATSIEKIAEGLGKVAPIAAQTHVGINELTAAIGTITAVTQRSGTYGVAADEYLESVAAFARAGYGEYAGWISGMELGKCNDLYAWHISDLKIYDQPKELNEFRKPEMPTGLRYENDTITRPPQSWCYVEELEET